MNRNTVLNIPLVKKNRNTVLKYSDSFILSPKNVGNLGTGFLRKVTKSEEGLTRISRINVSKKQMEKVERLRDFLTI